MVLQRDASQVWYTESMWNHMYYNWQPWPGPAHAALGILFGLVIGLLAVWTLVWKGLALWKAAKLGHKRWFVALLIINTLGILDILYLYVFSKKQK